MEYLTLPFVEIEIRFGTLNKTFDSSIDKKYFEKINNVLKTGEWKAIETKNTIEHFQDNIRLINDTTLIMKENVLTKTISINSSPFDIRFSINQEFSLESYKNSFSKKDFTRDKQRTSYISDHFKYDLTVVKEKKNNINTIKYEVEIELLVNQITLTWDTTYLYDFLECKIYDIIAMVEPIPREKFSIDLK